MNCRKKSSVTRTGRTQTNIEGEKPSELYARMMKLQEKGKKGMFDQITNPARLDCVAFLHNRERNRAPVVLKETERVKTSVVKDPKEDKEYMPAQYCQCERDYYIFWQAPNNDTYPLFWKNIYQDHVRMIISFSETFSESDNSKCYPYFPVKTDSKMVTPNGLYTILLTKKTECKGYTIYELQLSSTDESDVADANKKEAEGGDEPNDDEPKIRTVSLYHMDSWSTDQWPDVDVLCSFVHAISKKEVQFLRQSKSNTMPYSVIQSHDGIGRAAAMWVLAILAKDIEKKECFDVEDLVRKLIKRRPGCFFHRIHVCVTFAAAFRLAGLMGWTPGTEEAKARARDIKDAYFANVGK